MIIFLAIDSFATFQERNRVTASFSFVPFFLDIRYRKGVDKKMDPRSKIVGGGAGGGEEVNVEGDAIDDTVDCVAWRAVVGLAARC